MVGHFIHTCGTEIEFCWFCTTLLNNINFYDFLNLINLITNDNYDFLWNNFLELVVKLIKLFVLDASQYIFILLHSILSANFNLTCLVLICAKNNLSCNTSYKYEYYIVLGLGLMGWSLLPDVL